MTKPIDAAPANDGPRTRVDFRCPCCENADGYAFIWIDADGSFVEVDSFYLDCGCPEYVDPNKYADSVSLRVDVTFRLDEET